MGVPSGPGGRGGGFLENRVLQVETAGASVDDSA